MTRISFFAAASLLVAAPARAGTPDWIEEAIAAPCDVPAGDAEALVLLDERRTVIESSGRTRTRVRTVTRILKAPGAGRGTIAEASSAQVKLHSMKAWSRLPSGHTMTANDKDALETDPSGTGVYDDVKVKVLSAPSDNAGTVVAFEVETEDRWYGMEDVWVLDDVVPACRRRYELELPAGWDKRESWIRTPPIAPRKEGGRAVWEVTARPAVPVEEMMPSLNATAAMLALRLVAPERYQGARSMESWQDLGAGYWALAGPRTEPDPEVRKLAASLSKAESVTERIAALAVFAQRDIRYVAIELGIGGLQPRAPASVLKNRFGDCKDKATLLVAMLRSIGVDASLVLVNTDRKAVEPGFPTYRAFNHAITAIRHPLPGAQAQDGELLFFDPTDDRVPLGDLPHALQGGRALVVSKEGGRLVDLPVAPARSNGTSRRVRVTVENGFAFAAVEETHRGAAAASLRGRLRATPVAKRADVVRRGIALRDAEISGVAVENLDPSGEPLVLKYRVRAPSLLSTAGDLRIVRASLFDSWPAALSSAKERRTPVELPYVSIDEEEIEVPLDGLALDEAVKPLEIDAGFLAYRSRIETKDGKLVLRRAREVRKLWVEPAELVAARDALKKAAEDARRAIVLKSSK